ncbi:hypothetical protein NGF19_13440 [Streptomyces sp. RY43-2]|uniref:Uncharacterized protein n=1 Tax=Streptomyces macrolidinus TaxID=2952607 RepID=A0ABT0ZDX0_9ACTN|nr:hypothetical protein [Streptomyces macrolidinus]MCN9241785.1 hypothetical protein [Streptomyces macrolidinus]
MSWTHDYRDVARNRRSTAGPSTRQGGAPQMPDTDPRVGIPRILRRRARWVSVRLRHPRG